MKYKTTTKALPGFVLSTEGEVIAYRTLMDKIARRPSENKVTYKSNDHSYTTIQLNGISEDVELHIAIWIGFNGDIPPDMLVDHKNLYQLRDNRLDSLELVTKQQFVDKRLEMLTHFSKPHLFMTPNSFSKFYENTINPELSFELRTFREEIELYVWDTDHSNIIEYIQMRLTALEQKVSVEDPMIYLEAEKTAIEDEKEEIAQTVIAQDHPEQLKLVKDTLH